MSIEHWDPQVDGELSETALRRKLLERGFIVSRYVYPPGMHLPEHSHDVDKIDAVVEGRFRLSTGGGEWILAPGDRLFVPRGTVHSARVVGHEPVISLDATQGAES